jgi:hypothetical protein
VSEDEEEDVDSGWDACEPAGAPAAVPSAEVASGDRPTPVPDAGPSSEPLTVRVDVPLMPGRDLALDLDEPARLTRRAEEQELRLALTETAQGGMNRKVTPVHGNAIQIARKLDEKVTSRPTPPARPPVAPATPAAPAAAAGAALRFPAAGRDKAMQRGRAATKVNFAIAELAKASISVDEAGKVSSPALDLHLEGLELDGAAAEPGPSAEVPKQAASALSEPGADWSSQPPPPDSLELDDLPIDEMIESARPSSLPRRSSFPLALSEPFPSPSIPRAPAAPTMAAVKRRLAEGPALRALDEAFDDVEAAEDAGAARVVADISVDESTLSEEEQLAILEAESDVDADHADPLAVTAEAPVGAALAAYMALSKESLGVSADDPLSGELDALRARFERGDFMGVHMRVERLLEEHPDYAPALELKRLVQARLKETYKARLGSGAEVLRVMMRPDEVQGLSLDHRAGFLMSLCDGMATIDDVVDMAGMDELDVLRLLYEMREQGVVAISDSGR